MVALGIVSKDEPKLAAATNHSRTDNDLDGLSDLQELVIGTMPYRADTDGDGYSDLEERARGSDPCEIASLPEPSEFSLGSCANLENGFVTVLSALYVANGDMDSVRLEVGVVYKGRALRFAPGSYTYSRGYLYNGHDAGDRLAVVEIGVPHALLQRLGQVNMFSVLRGTRPGMDTMVSVMPIADFSGVPMSIEHRFAGISSAGGGLATGVIYRPLVPDPQDLPIGWNQNEICFRKTSAVGMKGVSIVHDVEASDCIEMDSYCNQTDCRAGVGQQLELPDPAALAGG